MLAAEAAPPKGSWLVRVLLSLGGGGAAEEQRGKDMGTTAAGSEEGAHLRPQPRRRMGIAEEAAKGDAEVDGRHEEQPAPLGLPLRCR